MLCQFKDDISIRTCNMYTVQQIHSSWQCSHVKFMLVNIYIFILSSKFVYNSREKQIQKVAQSAGALIWDNIRHIGVNLALQLTVKIAWKRVKLAPCPQTFHLSHPSPPQFLPFSPLFSTFSPRSLLISLSFRWIFHKRFTTFYYIIQF